MADEDEPPKRPGRTTAEIAGVVVIALVAILAIVVFAAVGRALS